MLNLAMTTMSSSSAARIRMWGTLKTSVSSGVLTIVCVGHDVPVLRPVLVQVFGGFDYCLRRARRARAKASLGASVIDTVIDTVIKIID